MSPPKTRSFSRRSKASPWLNKSCPGTELEQAPSTSSSVEQPKGNHYLPSHRSGEYAILMALLKKESKSNYRGFMTKRQLKKDAQQFCDKSLTKPDSKKHLYYTEWRSIDTLVRLELVEQYGDSPIFLLSPAGRSIALKLLDTVPQEPQLRQASGSKNGVSDYEVSTQDVDCEVVE